MNILGYDVFSGSLKNTLDSVLNCRRCTIINTINPHSYVVARADKDFELALKSSDILLPDGSGIVFSAKFLHGSSICKVAGYDLYSELMLRLNAKSGKVFFLGSTQFVLDKIVARASMEYPQILIDCLSPPYCDSFSEELIDEFAKTICTFSPDVVFVGLTAPKQEKLIYKLVSKVDVSVLSGVGAVFDFYAGTVKRPSKLWVDLHLEWMVRLLGEPRRLWRRNFISTPVFLWDLIRARMGKQW